MIERGAVTSPFRLHRPTTRRVIVSLHDVAPPFEAAIRQQLALLGAIGVRRVVLKVVPNWHGAHPLPDAPGLVELLRTQVAAGSQLVLHGEEHQARGAFHGAWQCRLRARLFAVDTAEFLTLSAPAAEVALRRGLACFEECGFPRPSMFCAPGWLQNAEAEAALSQVGLRYLIGMFTVRDLRTHHYLWTPGVGYMGASRGQELGVNLLNGIVRWMTFPSAAIAKVYLHPQRDPVGAVVRQRLAELAELIERHGWRPSTYAEVCDDGNV
jgi:predicted deacetylase